MTSVPEVKSPRVTSERVAVALLAGAQIVYFVDFQFMAILGPEITRSLSVPSSQVGYMITAYAAAAALVSLVLSPHLDRFDRKSVLAIGLVGQSVSIALSLFARTYPEFLAARFLVGAFSSPAVTMVFALVADLIPKERQGRALSFILLAFPIAITFGISGGLLMTRAFGWWMPFLCIAAFGLLNAALIYKLLPVVVPAKKQGIRPGWKSFFQTEWVAASYMLACLFFSQVLVNTNLTAYYKYNLGYSTNDLVGSFFIAGVCAMIIIPIGGRVVDRYGAFVVCVASTLAMSLAIFSGFMVIPPLVSIAVVQSFYTVGNTGRQVSIRSVSVRVPLPNERARFNSLQTALQQIFLSFGAFVSALMLQEGPGHTLIGMNRVAMTSIIAMLTIPVVLVLTERHLKSRAAKLAPVA